MRPLATGLLVFALMACERSHVPPTTSPSTRSPVVEISATPSSRTSTAPDPIASAFERFTGYPHLHGTVVLHNDDGDFHFELWAREPEFRVDARLGSEVVPWIVNEEGSNIREPHLHAPLLIQTDPRNMIISCEDHEVIGTDSLLGRPVTGVACTSGTDRLEYWIDDATGLVLAGSDADASWEFTSLELDPIFPSGVFEFDGSSGAAD